LALPADLSLGRGSPSLQCAACMGQPPPLDACFAAVAYGYPWSMLLADYKFGQDAAWAGEFARLLRQTPGVAQTLASMGTEDLLIPVPLSAQRLQSRGFNQAWELTKALARLGHSPARPDAKLLLRIRHTLPQSQLKREARLKNVKGAFVVDPLRTRELAHRRVVLVDDVMTSGASLFSAAQALREAGAAHITGLVFARTE
jgi:ComF family protein